MPIAVITGGARGIGQQLAVDLVARGYRVVIADLDDTVTDATATSLGPAASAVHLDVTDRENITAVIEHVETTIGPVDLWINNAGIMPTGAFAAQSIDVARAIVDVDYTSVIEATGAILPRMLERGSGTIVNMASATGIKPLAGVAAYSGAKAAVIAFSSALRRELRGSGVRIIVVMPNLVRTALGAGISPPALTGSLSAAEVSRAVLRALDRGTFAVVVPRRLAPLLHLSALLPVRLSDWIDDRVGSDRIGLGGDPATRAAYLAEVLARRRRE